VEDLTRSPGTVGQLSGQTAGDEWQNDYRWTGMRYSWEWQGFYYYRYL